MKFVFVFEVHDLASRKLAEGSSFVNIPNPALFLGEAVSRLSSFMTEHHLDFVFEVHLENLVREVEHHGVLRLDVFPDEHQVVVVVPPELSGVSLKVELEGLPRHGFEPLSAVEEAPKVLQDFHFFINFRRVKAQIVAVWTLALGFQSLNVWGKVRKVEHVVVKNELGPVVEGNAEDIG